MKLLALHGHLQNGKRFRGQTAALTRHLKKVGVELIFIDAPYLCPDPGENSPLLTWVKDNSISESEETILKAYHDNPDIVGIFGFSMGAMLGLHLAAMAANDPNSPFSWIKIMISASAPWPQEGSPLLQGFPCQSSIPILFVLGLTDQIALPDSQRQYFQYFTNKTIFEHEGAHYIPSARQFLQNYFDFFSQHPISS